MSSEIHRRVITSLRKGFTQAHMAIRISPRPSPSRHHNHQAERCIRIADLWEVTRT